MLQELFAKEIAKIDEGFFRRLDESAFYLEDKSLKQKYSLFNDDNFTDKDYYKKFPTIHHLIKALINDETHVDIRLLYLACHTIIKNRGHFLFEGKEFNTESRFDDAINELFSYLRQDMEIDFAFEDKIADIKEILENKKIGMRDKQNALNKKLSIAPKDKQKKEIIKLIVGASFNLKTLFNDEKYSSEKESYSFAKSNYEEKEAVLESLLGDGFGLILRAKAVYDSSVLSEILGNETYLSFAKVKIYDKHKEDLAKLKKVIKTYHADEFKKVFAEANIQGNYCSYVGSCKKNGKKVPIEKRADKDAFYDFLKKILKDEKAKNSDADYAFILNEIELKTFLPKQVSKKNANIPYQLRRMELEKIVNNAEKYFSFLSEKDEYGTVKEKIIQLLTFKRPYYIGIIQDTHKEKFPDRCWVVKKENAKNEKITPWNFYDHIDEDKTAEAFITSRTNKCTYLIGEDVLPRNSLLYMEYTVLNELNNLKVSVDGVNIFDVKLKKKIYEQVFKQRKEVSKKTIADFLKKEGICKKENDVVITGIDEKCTTSLKLYIDIKKIIGKRIEEEPTKNALEDIILWASIYDEGEGRKILEAKIQSVYPDVFTQDELNKILKLKISGWGRFSRKFLESIVASFPGFTDTINIITAMRETNFNLMELLGDAYGFSKGIEKFNSKFNDDKKVFSYDKLVKDLYLSPSVKRMLWRALVIVKEVKSIMGKDPKKYLLKWQEEKKLKREGLPPAMQV
ncbi:CRISPR-associated protein, Csn1 family [Treponema phagedenis F0421]|nr:CRISPR-associated protein, Csn1 family [Treponema phagedenis F0421]